MEAQLNKATHPAPLAHAATAPMAAPVVDGWVRVLATLFKLRIGLAIALSALAGWLVSAGSWPALGDGLILLLGVLVAAAGAGGCNHYFERDIDAHMRRTRQRPFVSGRCHAGIRWLVLFMLLMLLGSTVVGVGLNATAGVFTLAGALTYSVVYTLWLKRRTHWNIVIGGLSGSFAVLAGASAAGDLSSAAVVWLAILLFLWTPSHFWALAIAIVDDYRQAGVPMLPVTHGTHVAAVWSLVNTALLVASSIGLAWSLAHWSIWVAVAIGAYAMLQRGVQLVRDTDTAVAMRAFRASLLQLGTLLLALFLHFGLA